VHIVITDVTCAIVRLLLCVCATVEQSNQKQNWLAYAVANHLAGNSDTAVKAVDSLLAFDTVSTVTTCTTEIICTALPLH
jgi:hypothetical protein